MSFPKHNPPSPDQPHHAPELERRFLRLGVEGMASERTGCSRCGRSPLVGERLFVFETSGGEVALCDICRAGAPEGSLGQPLRIQRTRASERGLNVRAA